MAIQKNADGFKIVQTAGDTYEGNDLDQTYQISPTLTSGSDDNKVITIVDQGGNNTIELAGGLTITSSIVISNEAQLVLSNGAIINIRGADTFTFSVGANTAAGQTGVSKTFAEFATDVLGVTLPAEGEAAVTSDAGATIETGGAVTPTDPTTSTYTLTAAADSVAEGATATFNLTTDGTVAEGTEVAYTITGVDAADVDGGVLTGTATIAADGTATISVALLADLTTEGAETLTVTLDGTSVSASSTVNDTSEAPTGKSFTLTTGTDSIEGTADDEAIIAVNSASISDGTLQTTDTIDGGEGTDTLQAEMQQNWTGFTTGSMKNVENVELTAKTTAAISYAATGSTGVTSYTVKDAAGNVTLTDLDVLADLDITGPATTSTLSATYNAASTVATGTQTDTQKLKVTNVGTIDTDASSATNAKFLTVNIEKVEALDITTAGDANSLTLSGVSDTKTITLSGEGQTEISAIGGKVTSFDASAATGNVIADLSGAATGALTSVKAGAGDDSLTVALDDLSATAAVEGGAGTDALNVSSSGSKTLQATMTGVEAVNFTAPGSVTGAVTFSGTNVTGLESTTVSAGTLGGNIAFVNMGSQDFTINTTGAVSQAGTEVLSSDNTGAFIANLNATSTASSSEVLAADITTGVASSVVINVAEYVQAKNIITTTTAGAVTLNVASKVVNNAELSGFIAATPGTDGLVTADSASSLTVNADGALTDASLQADKATTVTIKAGATAAATLHELDASLATTLNLEVGSKGLDMDGAGTTDIAKVQTVSATNSGHLDFTNVNLSASSNATFTGSGTASQLTLADVGATTQTYNNTLTISGQKAGLTVGAIDAGTGKTTVDVSGVTGTTSITSLDGDAGVTLTATNIGDTLTVTGNTNAAAGSIILDVTNATKAFELGGATDQINAGDTTGTGAVVKGDVTVTATNAIAGGQVGIITGDNVSVDATNALATVAVGNAGTANTDIFAKSSVTYKGATLSSLTNAADIAATNESTALAVNLTGGAGVDTFTIAGGTKQESITVSGDVGAGTQSLTVTLGDTAVATKTVTVDLSGYKGSDKATTTTSTVLSAEATNAITYKGSAMNDTVVMDNDSTSTISITDTTTTDSDNLSLTAAGGTTTLTKLSVSGVEKITVDDANLVTINASAISGQTIDFIGDTGATALALTGTAGADVIDLSKATTSGTQVNFTVTGSTGDDSVVLSTAGVSAETVQFIDTNGKDTISTFKVGEDFLNFAQATVNGTLAELAVTNDAGAVLGTTTLDDTNSTVYVFDTDATGLGSATAAAISDFTSMTAVATFLNTDDGVTTSNTTGKKDFFVINDGDTTNAYVYEYVDVAGGAGDILAAELTLIGVVSADTTVTTAETVLA